MPNKLELFDIVYLEKEGLAPFAMVPVEESSRAILASRERIHQAAKRSPIVGVVVRDGKSFVVAASRPDQTYVLSIFAKYMFAA